MIVDTHTHLYLDEFAPAPVEAVDRAIAAGVEKMIFPNIDLSTIAPMQALAEQRPENIRQAMGLHPTSVGEDWREQLAAIGEHLHAHADRYVAVGEVGIDLYWDKTFAESQMQALETQARWAAELSLPIILHQREGLEATLEVLSSLGSELPPVLFHSFGGTTADVDAIHRLTDAYFGINGIVTFKNSRLASVLPAIGVDRLVLETDSPYLAPVPMRGRRNESAYIIHTAHVVASALSMPFETVADTTTATAHALFPGL